MVFENSSTAIPGMEMGIRDPNELHKWVPWNTSRILFMCSHYLCWRGHMSLTYVSNLQLLTPFQLSIITTYK